MYEKAAICEQEIGAAHCLLETSAKIWQTCGKQKRAAGRKTEIVADSEVDLSKLNFNNSADKNSRDFFLKIQEMKNERIPYNFLRRKRN